jgi:hypothetical protein
MEILELKNNLRKVISLQEEIKDLTNSKKQLFSLTDFMENFRNCLIYVDHGERDRFFVPMNIALNKLNNLSDIVNNNSKLSFSQTKTKLLSIMNRYIKDLQRGFEEHDSESNLTHRD